MKPIITLLLLLGSFYSFSQVSIKGTVLDEEGETLPFANIVLEIGDQTWGAVSDLDGNYHMKKVPAGKYNLKASYIGAKTNIIEGVVVNDGKITVQNFEMEFEGVELTECLVIAERQDIIRYCGWSCIQVVSGISDIPEKEPDLVEQSITVFPNPMQLSATVVFDNPIEEMFSYSIYDMSGRLVKHSEGNTGSKFTIQREGLERGAYIIEVQAGLNRQTARFVVQ